MKKRIVSNIWGLLVIGLLAFALYRQVFAASGSYPGIGNRLPVDSTQYVLSSYAKVYFHLIRVDNGDKVVASDGSLSSSVTWANAAIDCTDDAAFKVKYSTVPSGLTRGGNYLIRWYASSDATADNADTCVGIGYVRIVIVAGSPAFEDLPQSF